MIIPDLENRRGRLGLGRLSRESSDLTYILYHEFSHVADRINPRFKYSEERKAALSEHEQMAVMELWNFFIDARLNRAGVFQLIEQPACPTRKQGLIPNTIQGRLQLHAVLLETLGVRYELGLSLVTDFWNDPTEVWSYEEMIEWVKGNTGEQDSREDRATQVPFRNTQFSRS
jgi:hypothetical protein